jgi:hypothetical protein
MNRITEIYSLLQEDLEDSKEAISKVDDGIKEFKSDDDAVKELEELKRQILIRISANRKVYMDYIKKIGGNEDDIALNALAGNLILN